jgi:hypothetical protein
MPENLRPHVSRLERVDPFGLLTEQDKESVRALGMTPWPDDSLVRTESDGFRITTRGLQYFSFAKECFHSLAQVDAPSTLREWKEAAARSRAEIRAPVLCALEKQLQDGSLEPQYRDYARATLHGTLRQRRKALDALVAAFRGGANIVPLSFLGRIRSK